MRVTEFFVWLVLHKTLSINMSDLKADYHSLHDTYGTQYDMSQQDRINAIKERIIAETGIEQIPKVRLPTRRKLSLEMLLAINSVDGKETEKEQEEDDEDRVTVMAVTSEENESTYLSFKLPRNFVLTKKSLVGFWIPSQLYPFLRPAFDLVLAVENKNVVWRAPSALPSWKRTEVSGEYLSIFLRNNTNIMLALGDPVAVETFHYHPPPLMVFTPEKSYVRKRRQASGFCGDDRTRRCCRQRLYVDFTQLGWGDWIIWPRGYQADYCMGPCSATAVIGAGREIISHHGRIMIERSWAETDPSTRQRLTPCCSPKKLDQLTLLYVDEAGHVIKQSLPNMKVRECGCS